MIDNYFNIDSIDPQYWGKSGWIFLNSIALTYNPEYKENYKKLMEQLPYILPCKTCGSNLKKNMAELDNALESKQNLLNWLLKIRNEIYEENQRYKDKKTLNDNIDEIFYKRCDNKLYIYLSIMILVLILLIVVYKFMKKDNND
jgi:hypothetical protein